MKEPDFITTISRLKEYVKEAEEAVKNKALKKYVFQFLQPLRNTGCSQGIGQVEESYNSLVGEIDLIRERQLKTDTARRVFCRGIEYEVLHSLPKDNFMVVNVDDELPAQVSVLNEDSIDEPTTNT